METPQVADGRGASPTPPPIDLVWAVTPLVVPLVVGLLAGLRMVDLAYHVRLGTAMLEGQQLISQDTMTFTVLGQPWVNQQWLSQIILAGVYDVGGWDLLSAVRGLLVAATFGFVFLATRGKGASVRASSLLSLAAFAVVLPALSMRPQLFAILGFAAGTWAVVTRERSPRRIWILPPLALVLANMHGSFPLVLALATYAVVQDAAAKRRIRPALTVLGVSAVATFVNPYGLTVWSYVIDLSTDPTIRSAIREWQPLSMANYAGVATILSVLGIIALLARRREVVPWLDLGWILLFLVPAFATERAAVWWAIVAATTAGGWLSVEHARRSHGNSAADRLLSRSMVAVFLVLPILALPWFRGGPDLLDAPKGLSSALDRLPSGSTVIVHQPWASWVEYANEHLVFVDSRVELFPPEIWNDYDSLAFARADWATALARWAPDAIVADARTWDLIPFLREDPGWRVAAEDDDFVLFVRA